MQSIPPLAPRSPSFAEAGDAVARLIVLAGSDIDQAAGAASFLLAWQEGPASPYLLQREPSTGIGSLTPDMVVLLSYIAAQAGVYPDSWGFGDAMKALADQRRRE